MVRFVIVCALGFYSTTVAAKAEIPANVIVAKNKTIQSVDWSFTPNTTLDFARVKRCVATGIKNDDVQLRDAAGSWVGPATGNYYSSDNRQTAQAKSAFKILDDENKFLIANGQTDRTSGLSGWVMRFELEAALQGDAVLLIMRNITQAASNTGILANDGFKPVGVWYRFKSNYAALEAAIAPVRSCLGSSN